MEDSVEGLLDRAADAEALRDSLADVDLSAPEDDDEDGKEEEDEQAARDRDSSAVSALVSPRAGGGAPPQVVRAMPMLRNTSWDKDAVGNDDTTEVCASGGCFFFFVTSANSLVLELLALILP